MSEVITVQLGQYSNFIGSHFWNIQESNFCYSQAAEADRKYDINHDVLFREGQNLQKETTYTPRLVCVDLKDSLGSLSQAGSLYSTGQSHSQISWGGQVEVHKHEKRPKNPFLTELEEAELKALGAATESEKDICSVVGANNSKNESTPPYKMEDHVKVWTDYLRPHFHPRSVLLTKEYEYEDATNPFDAFGCGVTEWTNTELGDEITDSLRFFAEECDSLQGFHFLFDSFNGFSGVAHKTFEYMYEEFSSKVIHAFPTLPGKFETETYKTVNARLMNLILSFGSAFDHSTIYTPLTLSQSYKKSGGRTLPGLNYNDSAYYHTSAILASALDTMTLPYRLKGSLARFGDVVELHGNSGRKLNVLSAVMPLGMLEDELLVEFYARHREVPWTPLCPVSESGSVLAQSVVLRGVPETKLKRHSTASPGRRVGLIGATSVHEATEIFLYEKFPRTVNSVTVNKNPLKTVQPFPQFFSVGVGSDGFLHSNKQSKDEAVLSLPMLTSLQNGDVCRSTLDLLLQDVKPLKVKRFNRFFEFGLEEEDWSDCLEKLSQSTSGYEEI